MFRQCSHMGQRQLPFATQNHPAQRPVNVQQPRQVRRAHVVRVQQMLQRFQRGHLGRVQMFPFVIFNQAAKQVEIILLVCRQFMTGHGVGDFRHVRKIYFVVNCAWYEHPAQPGVIFWQAGEFNFGLCRFQFFKQVQTEINWQPSARAELFPIFQSTDILIWSGKNCHGCGILFRQRTANPRFHHFCALLDLLLKLLPLTGALFRLGDCRSDESP